MKRILKEPFKGKHPSLVYLEALMSYEDSCLTDIETLSFYTFFVEKANKEDREKMAKKFIGFLQKKKLTESEQLEEIFESDFY